MTLSPDGKWLWDAVSQQWLPAPPIPAEPAAPQVHAQQPTPTSPTPVVFERPEMSTGKKIFIGIAGGLAIALAIVFLFSFLSFRDRAEKASDRSQAIQDEYQDAYVPEEPDMNAPKDCEALGAEVQKTLGGRRNTLADGSYLVKLYADETIMSYTGDLAVPSRGRMKTFLSCRGIGYFSDNTRFPVVYKAQVDSDGEFFVNYKPVPR